MQCPTGTFEFEAGGVYTELQCGFYIDQQIEDNDLHYLPSPSRFAGVQTDWMGNRLDRLDG